MDKYIKIKELEEVSGCKIKDIKELTSGKVYVIGVQTEGIPKDKLQDVLGHIRDAFNSRNIDVIVYPIYQNKPTLRIYEIEPKVKDISYMYQSND